MNSIDAGDNKTDSVEITFTLTFFWVLISKFKAKKGDEKTVLWDSS